MKVKQSFLNSLFGKTSFLARQMIEEKYPGYRIREVAGEETTDSPAMTIILRLRKEYLQVGVYVLVVFEAETGNRCDLEIEHDRPDADGVGGGGVLVSPMDLDRTTDKAL